MTLESKSLAKKRRRTVLVINKDQRMKREHKGIQKEPKANLLIYQMFDFPYSKKHFQRVATF